MPGSWKESIIVPIYKGDKTDCNNYRDMSLLTNTYKILSNILLSRLVLYEEEITGDHQRGFRSYRSTTDRIFCIRQILEIKWEYINAVTVTRAVTECNNSSGRSRTPKVYGYRPEHCGY